MSLAVYPSVPKPLFSYVLDHQFRTVVTDFDTGTEARNRRWRFSKRTFVIAYRIMEFIAAERDAIYEFYQNRLGIWEPFWFFDFQSRKWIDQHLGYGDGLEDTFDLPGNGTVASVYIDGTPTVLYSFSDNTGEGGADQIIFDSPPIGNSLLTADFTGLLRIKGRFKDDKLTEDITTKDLVNFSVSILEIKGAFVSYPYPLYLRDVDDNIITGVDGMPIERVGG